VLRTPLDVNSNVLVRQELPVIPEGVHAVNIFSVAVGQLFAPPRSLRAVQDLQGLFDAVTSGGIDSTSSEWSRPAARILHDATMSGEARPDLIVPNGSTRKAVTAPPSGRVR
jgi:hypothetical protein